jgi:hypothetical protein
VLPHFARTPFALQMKVMEQQIRQDNAEAYRERQKLLRTTHPFKNTQRRQNNVRGASVGPMHRPLPQRLPHRQGTLPTGDGQQLLSEAVRGRARGGGGGLRSLRGDDSRVRGAGGGGRRPEEEWEEEPAVWCWDRHGRRHDGRLEKKVGAGGHRFATASPPLRKSRLATALTAPLDCSPLTVPLTALLITVAPCCGTLPLPHHRPPPPLAAAASVQVTRAGLLESAITKITQLANNGPSSLATVFRETDEDRSGSLDRMEVRTGGWRRAGEGGVRVDGNGDWRRPCALVGAAIHAVLQSGVRCGVRCGFG